MKYSLEITENATEEMWDSFRWYEDRREGLGFEFMDCLSEAFNHLADAPFLYAPYRTHYRKMSLRRFPYSIIYRVSEEKQLIAITNVLHQKRSDADLFEE